MRWHTVITQSLRLCVIVFDDRVEIRTPGKLPNTVTIESMKWGVHVLRNSGGLQRLSEVGVCNRCGKWYSEDDSRLSRGYRAGAYSSHGRE